MLIKFKRAHINITNKAAHINNKNCARLALGTNRKI